MTFITISTIGYEEVIDLSSSPSGRIFTMFIALSGIGTLTYAFSMLTASIIEGALTDSFRRLKMQKTIEKTHHHFIVCGSQRIGPHIIEELQSTHRPYILIEENEIALKLLQKKYPDILCIQGDPTDNEILKQAGIDRAEGLFAATEDDNNNLVICLSAHRMNLNLRIISHASNPKNIEKMKHAGASSVISSDQIGGLRMASEMARPTVVSFLDFMMRDKQQNLRIEEIPLSEKWAGKQVKDLNLKLHREILLLALRDGTQWTYNPEEKHVLKRSDILICMTTPDGRLKAASYLNA